MYRTVLAALLVASLVAVSPEGSSISAETGLSALNIDTDVGTDRVGMVDPSTGRWHLRGENGVVNSFFYGVPGDFPIAGDWNCDGIDTPGLYRQSDGFVYLRNSNTEGVADISYFFGQAGDIPIAGDFNGNGCDTVSIYRPSEGRVHIINSLGTAVAQFSYFFGIPGDKPFVGDFNGNGVDTVGLHRESTGFVYFRQSHTQGVADSQFFFGNPGDRLIAGDWGIIDGVDSVAIFRPIDEAFYFRYTNTQGFADETLGFGASNFLPVAGKWTPGLALTGTLPNALFGESYAAQLSAIGGSPPYTFQKLSGPAWVNVSASGAITGTAPNTTGTSNLTVRVTDSRIHTDDATFSLQVVNGCEGNTGAMPLAQCQALVQLYRQTAGHNWTEKNNWLAGEPCQWQGITCGTGGVIEIELNNNNLVGSLPTASQTPNHIGQFTVLQVLDLDSNSLSGALPAELGTHLPSVTRLDLAENGFTGAIPDGIWSKASLMVIDLGDNGLTGTIPNISALTNLQELDLSENDMSGVPDNNLWLRSSLAILDLNGNAFSGTVPTLISSLNALQILDLGENAFTGDIPAEIGGLPLTHLDLHDNDMGSADPVSVIPDSITGLGTALIELAGNICFTASAGTTTFLDGKDPAWRGISCPPA